MLSNKTVRAKSRASKTGDASEMMLALNVLFLFITVFYLIKMK